jgi:hypothetical protein
MPKKCLLKESETDTSTKPQSSAISEHSTLKSLEAIEEWLTSLRAVSPVSIFPAPEKGPGLKEKSLRYGSIWREPFASFDRDSCSWKIPTCSLFEASTPFSGRWPKWGIFRNGLSYQLPTWARYTSEKGAGYWPTPTATMADCGGRGELLGKIKGTKGYRGKLATPTAKGNQLAPSMAKWPSCREMFPTPTSRDFRSGKHSDETWCGNARPLNEFVERFPTPRANKWGMPDSHGKAAAKFPTPQARDHFPAHTPEYIAKKKAEGHGMSNLNDRVGGSLNPDWEEALMLWPPGWTSLEPLESLGEWPANVWANGNPEPDIPRVAKGVPNRSARIKAIGNGQVPHCAAAAFVHLLELSEMEKESGEYLKRNEDKQAKESIV